MPSVDPKDIHGGDWELMEVTPDYRRWRMWISDTQYIMKTEYLEDDLLVKHNQHLLNESYGKRFGEMALVGRVPLNVLYGSKSEISKKMKEGDEDHLKWWLNSEQARPFRTFRGRI